jgi:glycosyltransferase involved in cell wall biosynthesis
MEKNLKIKSKVLILHPSLAPYRVDFFNKLHEKCDASIYFSYRNVPYLKYNQEHILSQLQFVPHYLDKGFDFRNRPIRFGIIKLLSRGKFDVVITSEFSHSTIVSYLYKVIFRKKYRLYTISDDSIYSSMKRSGIRAFLRTTISKNIDGVIYTSTDVGLYNKTHFSSKINALELPIIHDDIVFRKKLSDSLSYSLENIKKYNLEHKKIVLFVGRLVEVKNLDVLIKAFSKVEEDNCLLVLVGDGPLRQALVDLVESNNILDRVLFIGHLEGQALYSWYNIAQISILPSIKEAFGAVVNEALLGGCHVICSKIAGAVSLINNENGLSFDPSNQEELTEKIREALQKVVPLESSSVSLRESKMPFTFNEKLDTLIHQL